MSPIGRQSTSPHITPEEREAEELVGRATENLSGKIDLVRVTSEGIGRELGHALGDGIANACKTISEAIKESSAQNKRPAWIDPAIILALISSICTASVSIFKADVAYGDHDTVVQLQTLVPRLEEMIKADEQTRAAQKRHLLQDYAPAAPAK